MEPVDFKSMISQIRYVESILGDGIKQITLERENVSLVRKSLVAACDNGPVNCSLIVTSLLSDLVLGSHLFTGIWSSKACFSRLF